MVIGYGKSASSVNLPELRATPPTISSSQRRASIGSNARARSTAPDSYWTQVEVWRCSGNFVDLEREPSWRAARDVIREVAPIFDFFPDSSRASFDASRAEWERDTRSAFGNAESTVLERAGMRDGACRYGRSWCRRAGREVREVPSSLHARHTFSGVPKRANRLPWPPGDRPWPSVRVCAGRSRRRFNAAHVRGHQSVVGRDSGRPAAHAAAPLRSTRRRRGSRRGAL